MLIQTKLFIPPYPTQIVHRTRLTEKLNKHIKRQLALVSAPAGFGKTTLVLEWVHNHLLSTHTHPVCWLSLDEEDNDPARFMRYLAAAWQTIGIVTEQNIHQLSTETQSIIVTQLVNHLVQYNHPCFFILDDYHCITNPLLHETLTQLLTYAPPNFHLILTSRTLPPFPLARWRAKQQIMEIRAPDLRFDLPETTTFLQKTMAIDITADDAQLLSHYTEGWAAGLQMAGLSLQGHHDTHHFVQSFSGHHHYIIDYLTDEVLRQQSPQIVDFLLKTAVLNRLTGALCDVVTQQTNSEQLLRQLDSANLFIIPLDEKRQWYRYHHLFTDLLRARLTKQEEAETIKQLHLRASQWYEAQQNPNEAIYHAIAAEAYLVAVRLIAQYAPLLAVVQGEYLTSQRWVDALPPAVVSQNPLLNLSLAQGYISSGHIAKSIRFADMAEEAAHTLSPEEADRFKQELLSLRATIAWLNGDLTEGVTLGRQSIAGAYTMRAGTYCLLGEIYTLSGNTKAAIDVIQKGITYAEQDQHLMFHVLALGFYAKQAVFQGKLSLAQTYANNALTLSPDPSGKTFPVVMVAYTILAEVARERNELKLAINHAQHAIQCGNAFGIGICIHFVIDAYITWVKALQADGQSGAATAVMQQALTLSKQYQIAFTETRLLACQAWLYLQQNNVPFAERWAKQMPHQAADLKNIDHHGYVPQAELMTLARIWLRQGEPEVDALLTALSAAAEAAERWRALLEIYILRALHHQQQGDLEAATNNLLEAIVLSGTENHQQLFLDEGEAIRPLLHHLAARNPTLAYVHTLLQSFPPINDAQTATIKLTKRERQVLQLIASGKTNQEIADILIISYATVKRHVNNLYAKLEVTSRTQAVLAAQEMGLTGL